MTPISISNIEIIIYWKENNVKFRFVHGRNKERLVPYNDKTPHIKRDNNIFETRALVTTLRNNYKIS